VPAIALSPSASVTCQDGRITIIAATPVLAALAAGLVPVVYGDVAFDTVRGGTIVSTEEVMMALAAPLRPAWLLLAGETSGVLDDKGAVVPRITPATLPQIATALGGSRGTDVTGGMASKVLAMLSLVAEHPYLNIRIFGGLTAGVVTACLMSPGTGGGTVLENDNGG
jgi:isopentenyl phosphate kinase